MKNPACKSYSVIESAARDTMLSPKLIFVLAAISGQVSDRTSNVPVPWRGAGGPSSIVDEQIRERWCDKGSEQLV